ncbi:prophage tail gpP-like protein [Angulomicrobium tetraedrale]|uniref:Prophage tail gpP-like protein n=1 Tax=Ancylobacter tetraedralis TaxID=217068 RepID=A0A839Z9U9_9HYPH|nr:hypothetical protein [Ancylobacter tetraedralis]MBB3771514.1 prophage tail gpP-like protein [Ancylobacter tetraedralis]
MLNVIGLSVAGRPLAFDSCELTASAEEAVRSGSFDVVWVDDGLPCGEDDECLVTIDGAPWLTGYVRDINWSADPDSRIVTVSVVSRTVDATEGAIDHPTGSIEDCDLRDIAASFDTGGVGVDVEIDTEKKPLHQIVPGETLFATLEREARAAGALIHDTPQGRLKIVAGPEGRHAGILAEGVNITRASGTLSGQFNYSEVKVRGQSSFGTNGAALRPEAQAKGTAQRKRTLIIYHEGELTSARAKKRAQWEAKRAAGRAKAASITVPGLSDAAGTLWTPNWLVPVDVPRGALRQDMVIAQVSFAQQGDGSGTEATLTLKDPRALGGENPRGDSAKGWEAPGEDDPSFRED